MHHKHHRARKRRAGCKPWKTNGVRNESIDCEKTGGHRRRMSEDLPRCR